MQLASTRLMPILSTLEALYTGSPCSMSSLLFPNFILFFNPRAHYFLPTKMPYPSPLCTISIQNTAFSMERGFTSFILKEEGTTTWKSY